MGLENIKNKLYFSPSDPLRPIVMLFQEEVTGGLMCQLADCLAENQQSL